MDELPGALYVFEGPDGVGKSTIHREIARVLSAYEKPVCALAFPGSRDGTLGKLVYKIHHDPALQGIEPPVALALQLLHVAAHVDAIAREIKSALLRGDIVLLDRYWWSTWVYGVVAGVPESVMDALVGIEEYAWGGIAPSIAFLLTRRKPLRDELDPGNHTALGKAYETVASRATFPVIRLGNDSTVADAVERVIQALGLNHVSTRSHDI